LLIVSGNNFNAAIEKVRLLHDFIFVLGSNYVMTAAHCTVYGMYSTVVIGAHDITDETEPGRLEITSYAENILVHPEFDFPHMDISLIRLPQPVTFNQYVSPVCLPPLSDVGDEYLGNEMTAMGWGYTSGPSRPQIEDRLRVVDKLPVLPDAACRALFAPNELGETFFCVASTIDGHGGHGTCKVRSHLKVSVFAIFDDRHRKRQKRYPTMYVKQCDCLKP
jgi:hypothetical protein